MAENEETKIESCLQLLKSAKSDNDRFAALLMVAKVTTSVDLRAEDRSSLLDAIGMQFLVRLLKSKSVPEGCPDNVYKVLSLNIISGLCTDPYMIVHSTLYKHLKILNEIIQSNSEDEVGRQMINNCYDIYQVYTQTDTGVHQLVHGHVVQAMCTVITGDLYGKEKADILLKTLLMKAGPLSWTEHHDVLLLLLEHASTEFEKSQDENKFILCKFLCDIIRTLPEELKEPEVSKVWIKRTIKSIRDILTSKIGQAQREPALELVSTLIVNLGVPFLLSPYTEDSKLLLIVTHLGCIETRMILENTPLNQIAEKSNLLCSCYQLIEGVINHMTTAPSLMLDDQQVLQLHAAMTGAFNAVILFLKELSETESFECPVSVVIATLRVLGAWLAEETSALREKVFEILPFLIRMCKTNFEENEVKPKQVSFKDDQNQNAAEELKNSDDIFDDADVNKSCDPDISEQMSDCDINKGDNPSHSNVQNFEKQSGQMECDNERNATDIPHSNYEDIAEKSNTAEQDFSSVNERVTCLSCDQENKIDLINFILPGLCHLTAEDKSRQILLSCNCQRLLEQYFRRCWNQLLLNKQDTALQGSMETLCNVFLNLIVTEPNLASEDQSLQSVTQLILEAVPAMGEDSITLKVTMVTLGLMLLQQQATVSDQWTKPVKCKFFTCVMLFLKGVHTCTEINKVKTLIVSDVYLSSWEEIIQMWHLSLQALKSCVSLYSEVEETMLSTGLFPHISKLYISVQGNGVTDDIKHSMLTFFATTGVNSSKVREVIKSSGGPQLARMYKFPELLR